MQLTSALAQDASNMAEEDLRKLGFVEQRALAADPVRWADSTLRQ